MSKKWTPEQIADQFVLEVTRRFEDENRRYRERLAKFEARTAYPERERNSHIWNLWSRCQIVVHGDKEQPFGRPYGPAVSVTLPSQTPLGFVMMFDGVSVAADRPRILASGSPEYDTEIVVELVFDWDDERAGKSGGHIVDGEFQSDKYPTCPAGKVPLSVKDPTAQDLLWEYAQRHRSVDARFAEDLELCLTIKGYVRPGLRPHNRDIVAFDRAEVRRLVDQSVDDNMKLEPAPWDCVPLVIRLYSDDHPRGSQSFSVARLRNNLPAIIEQMSGLLREVDRLQDHIAVKYHQDAELKRAVAEWVAAADAPPRSANRGEPSVWIHRYSAAEDNLRTLAGAMPKAPMPSVVEVAQKLELEVERLRDALKRHAPNCPAVNGELACNFGDPT